jgi:hypothetical protein
MVLDEASDHADTWAPKLWSITYAPGVIDMVPLFVAANGYWLGIAPSINAIAYALRMPAEPRLGRAGVSRALLTPPRNDCGPTGPRRG